MKRSLLSTGLYLQYLQQLGLEHKLNLEAPNSVQVFHMGRRDSST